MANIEKKCLMLLPEELIEQIVEKLSSSYDILAIILTCKQLMRIAGHLLYKNVTIHNLKSLKKFEKKLSEDKEKASLVTGYKQNLCQQRRFSDETIRLEMQARGISAATHADLYHFLFEMYRHSTIIRLWNCDLPFLKTLCLEYRPKNFHTAPMPLKDIFSRQHMLQDLTLVGADLLFHSWPTWQIPTASKSLKFIRLVDCEITPRVLESYMKALSCIEELEISTSVGFFRSRPRFDSPFLIRDWGRALECRKDTLKKLVLPNLAANNSKDCTLLLNQFTLVTHLETKLEEIVRLHGRDRKFKDTFPPNLVTLKVFGSTDHFSKLQRFTRILKGGKFLRKLRRVELEWMSPDMQSFPSSFPSPTDWALGEIEVPPCFVAVCKERGVELVY